MSRRSGHSDEEADRLAALTDLEILDTPPEKELDGLARLASLALGTQRAAISLLDRDRQWFKARWNIDAHETSREIAFCHHTAEAKRTLVVPDAQKDPRFCDNPLVTGDMNIRFYAGAPIFSSDGHCIGTLCAIDSKPRPDADEPALLLLEELAKVAGDFIEARAQRRQGEVAAKIVEATSDAVIAANGKAIIVYWNAAAERLFGYSARQAVGQSVELIIPERFRNGHQKLFEEAAGGGATRLVGSTVELMGLHSEGGEFPIELSLASWEPGENEVGFAAVVRDASERKALEEDRKRSQAFLDTIITNLPAMLFVKDARTRKYVMLNKAAEDLIGRPAEDMIGASDGELFPGPGAAFEHRDTVATLSEGPYVHESEFTRDDGDTRNIKTTRVLIDGPDRPGQYILGMSQDTTEIRRAQAENLRLARFDTLTGLLNRASLATLLSKYVEAQTPFAMLSIDLDRFKAVNDQYGHLMGDEVLRTVGLRLRATCDGIADVARIGGDEFVAIITGSDLRERSASLANRLIAAIGVPITARRITTDVGASVGIVIHPEDGQSVERLYESADLALYRSKSEGRGHACFFDAEMDAALRDRRKLEADLRHAVETEAIYLQYQPVVCARSRNVTSLEALARWKHPVRGPVRPDQFISLAEECGLIETLGETLLKKACRDALRFPESIRVAVNLSPAQFRSGSLFNTVRTSLAETGLAPERLQLEVTERMVIEDDAHTFEQLEKLRATGIQLLIDDFGVGHSSLSYFHRFPFDKVKIDKTFIGEVGTSRSARAIVEAVVSLGKQLSMGIVAEGVENEQQMELLTELGCTHLQGFLFSKALDAGDIADFLADFERASDFGPEGTTPVAA